MRAQLASLRDKNIEKHYRGLQVPFLRGVIHLLTKSKRLPGEYLQEALRRRERDLAALRDLNR